MMMKLIIITHSALNIARWYCFQSGPMCVCVSVCLSVYLFVCLCGNSWAVWHIVMKLYWDRDMVKSWDQFEMVEFWCTAALGWWLNLSDVAVMRVIRACWCVVGAAVGGLHRETWFSQGRSSTVPWQRSGSAEWGRSWQRRRGLCVDGRTVQKPRQRHAAYVCRV